MCCCMRCYEQECDYKVLTKLVKNLIALLSIATYTTTLNEYMCTRVHLTTYMGESIRVQEGKVASAWPV